MNFLTKIVDSVKYIKPRDLLDILIFAVTLPLSLVYKLYIKISKRHLWLFCEGENDARDNGYVLYKHTRENNPNINAYYVINKKSPAYRKVEGLGNVIQFGSLKHWIFYVAATKNISIHKTASPSLALFYVLHRLKILNGHRIFLQHGVIMNKLEYLYHKETNFELFVCGAYPEYKYVRDTFGYPDGVVQYLGLPRFDKLHDVNVNKKKIVIMPTWRSWLGREVNGLTKAESFLESEYYKTYQSLINNPELIKYIELNNIDAYFYPHAKMEKYVSSFSTTSANIRIVSSKESDILDLIYTSAMMITDYSSAAMDFAYMKKPLIYYQFDYERFRSDHLASGYFSYTDNGFGPVIQKESLLIETVEKYFDTNLSVEKKYAKRYDDFFVLRDTDNCKRVTDRIIELELASGRKIMPYTNQEIQK